MVVSYLSWLKSLVKGADLLAGLGQHLDDPRAADVGRFLVGFLDHMNLHRLPLKLSEPSRYLRGSGNCSMMNAQPLLSLGFFSAFLIT